MRTQLWSLQAQASVLASALVGGVTVGKPPTLCDHRKLARGGVEGFGGCEREVHSLGPGLAGSDCSILLSPGVRPGSPRPTSLKGRGKGRGCYSPRP